MTAALLFALVVLLFATVLRALRLLPGHGRDDWHHAWFGLITAGYLLGRLPWRAGQLAALAAASFGLLCLADDAAQHSVQAWRYRRATSAAGRAAALEYRSPLHLLARRVGLI